MTPNDDDSIVVPRYPASVRIPADDEATQPQIEAAWAVFDAEGLEAPPVEVMGEVWRAMWRAR